MASLQATARGFRRLSRGFGRNKTCVAPVWPMPSRESTASSFASPGGTFSRQCITKPSPTWPTTQAIKFGVQFVRAPNSHFSRPPISASEGAPLGLESRFLDWRLIDPGGTKQRQHLTIHPRFPEPYHQDLKRPIRRRSRRLPASGRQRCAVRKD
jgi:hypothetical protein